MAAAPMPWPDVRFWLRPLPSGGGGAVSRRRSSDASIAFDAYSHHLPGTREVCLGDERFFAFSAPRLGAEHLVVWRRVEDVRAAAEDWQQDAFPSCELPGSCPLRLTPCAARPQLTAPVWSWQNLSQRDQNRYWDDGTGGPWMYWESFWAPSEAAPLATTGPAFGDIAGKMLAPLLGAGEGPRVSAGVAGPGERVVHPVGGEAVASTAIGQAPKDRAYAIVYQFNVWGSDVSRSGTGSDFWSPEARLAVTALEAVVDAFGVRKVIDCACGDATWMVPYFVARHPEIDYTGVDIVPEVIEQNRQRHPGVEFLALDLAESPLPVGADLVFSKETLNHMSLPDAQNALRRFVATGARYLLTNVHEGAENEEGYAKTCYTTYVHYDYELPPFNMRRVARVVEYQGPRTAFSLFELPPP